MKPAEVAAYTAQLDLVITALLPVFPTPQLEDQAKVDRRTVRALHDRAQSFLDEPGRLRLRGLQVNPVERFGAVSWVASMARWDAVASA